MRTIKVIHDSSEYCVMDSLSSDGVREITVLIEPESPIVTRKKQAVLVPTTEGARVPVMRWIDGSSEPLIDLTKQQARDLESVIDSFLVDPPRNRKKEGGAVFYYNSSRYGDHLFTLSAAHPHGLAVNLYTSGDEAEKRALDVSAERGQYETRRTDDIQEFLCRTANEGYAGAVLDECSPIYFCLDSEGTLRFLMIIQDEDEEPIEVLLQPDGRWLPHESGMELNLFGDQADFDAASQRHLGDVPFLGWEGGKAGFVTIEAMDAPDTPKRFPLNEAVAAGDCEEMAVLFLDSKNAVEFMQGRGVMSYSIADVLDVPDFIEKASQEGLAVVLEPGNHRVRSGIFWFTEGRVILDSFSGFWKLEKEHGFTRLT